MSKLTKKTIQKLAVLRTLTLWQRGPYGSLRLQTIMFAADKLNKTKIFTFKKYYLGQYSEGISDALNALRAAGVLTSLFDGPAERLKAEVSLQTADKVRKLFTHAFPQWERELKRAFHQWGNLSNDSILKKAHEDAVFTEMRHGQVIFKSTINDTIDVPELNRETAEELADLVDERFTRELRKRIFAATKKPADPIDWRRVYFDEPQQRSKKAV
jgi:uncharacterized protein YwgA